MEFYEQDKPETPVEPYETEPTPVVEPVEEVYEVLPAPAPQEAEPPNKKEKKGFRGWKIAICVVAAVAFLVSGCLGAFLVLNTYWQRTFDAQAEQHQQEIEELRKRVNRTPTLEQGDLTVVLPDGTEVEGDLTPAQVYAMNVDAVVAISNQSITTNIFGQASQTASSGSGFLISADGYVVSNYHVIKGASTLTVITSDGVEHDATVVGYDETNDVSILKIDGTDYSYARLGSSDAMSVGNQVVAIGNPLGELTSTLTAGYISAKDRLVNTDGTSINMLQTDAAINSGNSGGPLFNMRGEVIGITTAKYSGTSNSGATIEGIGFAIPIDDVGGLIDDLIQFGVVKTGYLGVTVQDVPAEDSQIYGLPMGALVLDVSAGSCAEKAGIQSGDIIVDIGGNKVTSVSELTRVLRLYEPGVEAVVTVYRSGSEVQLNAVFDAKPQSSTSTVTPTEPTEPETDDFDIGGLFPFLP